MPVQPNKELTEKEINPLASLDEWEDAVLERYPEPGVPAKSKEEYRNYEEPGRDTVKEFYRLKMAFFSISIILLTTRKHLRN